MIRGHSQQPIVPASPEVVEPLIPATDARRRRGFVAPIMLFVAVAAPFLYLGVRWVGTAPPLSAAIGLCLLAIACWFAVLRGHTTAATLLFGAGLLAALVVPPVVSGDAGLSPYAASVVVGILILAGPSRLALSTILLTLLAVATIWLTTGSATSPSLEWRALMVGSAVITVATCGVVITGMRGIGDSLARLQAAHLHNTEVQLELERVRRQLDAAVKEQSDELRAVIEETEADIRELNRVAMRDPLTGLYNRRYLAGAFSQAMAAQRRAGQPLSVGLLDIDEFKSINDELSHSHGDAVLSRCATLMSAAASEDDVLIRIGGDEFLLLLPGADSEAAARSLRRIARVVSVASWEGQTPTGELSISWGVAPVRQFAADPMTSSLEEADRELRAAKSARGVRR